MFFPDIFLSGWGILVSALAYFIIGSIWYAPFLFGHECKRHDNKPENDANKESKPKSCWSCCKILSYVGELIISLIIACILAVFIEVSGAESIGEGIITAFWIWLGFIATTHFSAVLWGRKTVKHYFIHVCFMLVGLVVMGAVYMAF